MLAALLVALLAQSPPQGGVLKQGEGVEAGKDAVDFKLLLLKEDPKAKDEFVKLSDFKGKRPVLLIFGSYT
jgi:hypothetical protein